jgi:hypothetical protein
LSERSVEFQDSVESWSPRIGLLIVTSRKGVVVPYRMLEIHPLPISSVSVLSRYIENEIAKPQSNASADPLRDTASIVNILVHTIARNPDPGVETPLCQQITPLLATTFAALALELIQDGQVCSGCPRPPPRSTWTTSDVC